MHTENDLLVMFANWVTCDLGYVVNCPAPCGHSCWQQGLTIYNKFWSFQISNRNVTQFANIINKSFSVHTSINEWIKLRQSNTRTQSKSSSRNKYHSIPNYPLSNSTHTSVLNERSEQFLVEHIREQFVRASYWTKSILFANNLDDQQTYVKLGANEFCCSKTSARTTNAQKCSRAIVTRSLREEMSTNSHKPFVESTNAHTHTHSHSFIFTFGLKISV